MGFFGNILKTTALLFAVQTINGQNATTLNGIDASRFLYGDNATKTTNVPDFNLPLAAGFYCSNNATGLPDAGYWTVLNQSHFGTGAYGTQLAASIARGPNVEPMVKIRGIDNGTYSGWYSLLTQNSAVKTSPLVGGDPNINQAWGGTGQTGMYMFNMTNNSNMPGGPYAHIIEMQNDNGNNWTGQIALDYYGGGMYWRQQNNGNWTAYSGNNGWQEAASKSWVLAQLTATGNGTAYLPLSGGTLGGGLSVPNGNVLIGNVTGTGAGSFLLNVAGPVRVNKLTVNTTGGADFVFGQGYRLTPLAEVERYVKDNSHLPGVASAAEMAKNGTDVGEVQTKLLQKVEELTLYAIAQDKKQEVLEKVIAGQARLLLQMQKKLGDMEKKSKQHK